MSLNGVLSTLNNPLIISSLGAATHVFNERPSIFLSSLPLSIPAIKTAVACSYALNIITVSIPGRLDGQVAKAITEEEDPKKKKSANDKNKKKTVGEKLAPVGGKTLVAPAGWAFAIWGPIFLGELVSVSAAVVNLPQNNLGSLFQQIAIPFASANIFQSLWCASFREKFTKVRGGMYISTAMLASTAFCLGKVNGIVAKAQYSGEYTVAQYLLYFFPMSLHFGWVTAAALVNFNAAIALDTASSSTFIGFAGISTSVAAAVGGLCLAISRGAPVFSGVISWALFAVADGMRKRIAAEIDKETKIDDMFWETSQLRVSTVGAWGCAITTAFLACTRSFKLL